MVGLKSKELIIWTKECFVLFFTNFQIKIFLSIRQGGPGGLKGLEIFFVNWSYMALKC